jgi:hypothetical protein
MKQNKNFLYIIAAGAIAFAGCRKKLDLEPTDTFGQNEAVRNINDLQAGYYGAQSRNNRENTMFFSAVASDEIFIGAGNGGQGQFENRWQYGQDVTTGGGATSGWGAYYSMLAQTNNFLVVADSITRTSSADSARVRQIKGQLLTLRAIAHFELLERYGQNIGTYDRNALGVPVVTMPQDQFAAPTRNTVGEVVDQIEKDLREASSLLPASFTFTDTSINRITVAAFHARVALHKRAWQQAVDSATRVINSNVRPLTDSARLFAQIWEDSTLNTEVLYRVKRSGTGVGDIFTTAGNQAFFSPSNKLRATFTANDKRVVPYFGSLSGTLVRKFFQSALGGRRVDVKYMRTAEMYLIRAEAYAELGGSANITLGAADLNFLRGRRITGYVNQTFTTTQGLIDEVMLERYKELCFEGFRFFDLKRRGLPIDRLASDVTSTNWQFLPAGNFRFILPIPVGELQANQNIRQNLGY